MREKLIINSNKIKIDKKFYGNDYFGRNFHGKLKQIINLQINDQMT